MNAIILLFEADGALFREKKMIFAFFGKLFDFG